MEHIYSLYSVVNKRKLDRQSTFACFVDAKKMILLIGMYKLLMMGIGGKSSMQ